MIKIAKLTRLVYKDGNYHIFSGWCGENITVVYEGSNPPKPLKTVDYKLIGEFERNKKHVNRFVITDYEKVGKIKIHKNERRFNLNDAI